MANRLKMAVVNSILTLGELGWSQRRIAGVLGIEQLDASIVLRQKQNGLASLLDEVGPSLDYGA